jgi:hypothetical protein
MISRRCFARSPPASFRARLFVGVKSIGTAPEYGVFTFENNCLDRKLTFGDPFEDSGVVRGSVRRVTSDRYP